MGVEESVVESRKGSILTPWDEKALNPASGYEKKLFFVERNSMIASLRKRELREQLL